MTPMLPAQAAAFGLKPSAACCSDMATGTCGSQMGNMCVPPPPPAPNCPAPPPFMGFAASSCCIQSTQMCGIDASSFGLGCFSLSSIPGIGSGMQMRKCDGTVVMPPGQAGTGGGAGRGAAGGSAGGGATAGTGSSSTAGAGGARAGAGGGSAAGAGAGRGAAGAAGR
ncbi:MAG TPA: hypothetical protein VJR89_12800 [Polyangiales bacterium]|nr:hypothetical protein [Polyangiales bacterium]